MMNEVKKKKMRSGAVEEEIGVEKRQILRQMTAQKHKEA